MNEDKIENVMCRNTRLVRNKVLRYSNPIKLQKSKYNFKPYSKVLKRLRANNFLSSINLPSKPVL